MHCKFIFTDATHTDTVEEGSIFLVGGDTPNIGRVEIFLHGQWGTLCDYGWDLADATVVCHQLGFLRAVRAPRYATFGAGSGPSWYGWLSCTGAELNLTECGKYFSAHGSACSHSRDAGVECSSEPIYVMPSLLVHLHIELSCVKCCCI